MMTISYPPEPEHYDRGLIERHYAAFGTGEDSYRHLISWRHEWEKRLKETSGFFSRNGRPARPRLCQLQLEAVTAEIEKRDEQLIIS